MGKGFRIPLAVAVALLVAAALVTLRQPALEDADVGAEAVPYVLRFGHDMPENSAQHVAALKFASLVQDRSGGRVEVKVFPDQQLGTDYQMIEAARTGDLAITLAPTAKLSSLLPEVQYVDLPFLFPSREDAYALLDGDPGRLILEKLEPHALIGVTFWESGFKQFTANRPIHRPCDFNGLKVRVMKSPLLMDQFRAFGATPILIDFQHTYQALADGVVDAQENPLVSIVNRKFHEVQSDLTISNHGYLGYVFMLSKKVLDTLPEEIREALFATAKELTPFQREETVRRELEFLEKLERSGIRIHYLSEAERNRFRMATQHLTATYWHVIGRDIQEATIRRLGRGAVTDWDDTVVIGLDADMTLGSGESGLAIKRGMKLAVEEINAAGGVLGRELNILVRDHGGISARGLHNMEFFSGIGNLVAVIGGLHSPVALSQLDFIHRHEIIYLSPWAAATGIVENGYEPNYVFRVSVNDRLAGRFLVGQALRNHRNIALLLENTSWGRSNHEAMTVALAERGAVPAAVEWLNWGEDDLSRQLLEIVDSGAEALLLVANAPEGATVVRTMARLPRPIPIFSHWGITGGAFHQMVRRELETVDLRFLQTFSFACTQNPKVREMGESYLLRYHLTDPAAIPIPSGTAHAYDLVHLLARAIEVAGNLERSALRDALERLGLYHGLVKTYDPPFTPNRHDALDITDYFMARYDDRGFIVPLPGFCEH